MKFFKKGSTASLRRSSFFLILFFIISANFSCSNYEEEYVGNIESEIFGTWSGNFQAGCDPTVLSFDISSNYLYTDLKGGEESGTYTYANEVLTLYINARNDQGCVAEKDVPRVDIYNATINEFELTIYISGVEYKFYRG